LLTLAAGALAVAAAGTAWAQDVESELVLITPVAKTLTDPALAEFAKYAKEKWNIAVRTSALAAGTPVAYGRIVEWKGRPEADIFWGGESALFDKLGEQNLIAKLDLPKAVVDAIPDSIGKPKPIPLKDPRGLWIGTVLEPYGLVYHPKLFERLGIPPPKD
jgi:iron(III) transport system substrate-binding protein